MLNGAIHVLLENALFGMYLRVNVRHGWLLSRVVGEDSKTKKHWQLAGGVHHPVPISSSVLFPVYMIAVVICALWLGSRDMQEQFL